MALTFVFTLLQILFFAPSQTIFSNGFFISLWNSWWDSITFLISCFAPFIVRHAALTWIPYLKKEIIHFLYPIFCNWQGLPHSAIEYMVLQSTLSTKAFIGLEQKSVIISNNYSQLWLDFCISWVTKNIDTWTWNAYQSSFQLSELGLRHWVLSKISLGSFTVQPRTAGNWEWAFCSSWVSTHWV